ncbi:MAG: Tpl protein, partial [Candidatus Cloacimonetes bacterium]|nr:Tpl protein [Candidatus Cloacimonadota bacterium]
MEDLVEVLFKFNEKRYYTNPKKLKLRRNQYVVVEEEKGADMGRVGHFPVHLDKVKLTNNVKKIIQIANNEDLKKLKRIREKEQKAKEKFLNALRIQPFDMNLVDIEYQFDGNKLTFYFTAESRVDFRNFLRDLAGIFRTRIELRQISEKQEIKRLGGLGPCGRELCCKKFNSNFDKVSMQMVRDQNITVSSSKISGLCGKLLCCLAYEHDFYLEKAKEFPPINEEILYNKKNYRVEKNNYLASTVELKDENEVSMILTLKEYTSAKSKRRLK